MNMTTGEHEVTKSPDGSVTLTSHRVRYERRATGESELVSITLDAVSSCGLTNTSHPWLLWLAVVAGLVGYYLWDTSGKNTMLIGIVVGIVLVVAYFATRRTLFRVSSAGESIAVSVTGTSRDAFAGFINAVDEAKLAYLGKVAA